MTLTTFNDTAISSNVTFETWVSSWNTAILSLGLVQTADTGQINFSTVVWPTVANTKAGFAIYAFNDSNQGSYPCYIRVDFGVGGSDSFPALWFTMGTSTNGAGVIGAITSPAVQFELSGSANYNSAVSGTTSRLTAAFSYNFTTIAQIGFLSIERIQTVSGTDSTTGLVFTWVKDYLGTNAFTYGGQQVLYFTGTQPVANYNAAQGIPTVFYNSTNTSTTWTNGGNNVYLGLIYPVGQIIHFPIQGFMVNYPGDIAPTSIDVIPIYGTNQNWYSVPVTLTTYLVSNGGSAQQSLLVRWS